jgi:hypothetical protein
MTAERAAELEALYGLVSRRLVLLGKQQRLPLHSAGY